MLENTIKELILNPKRNNNYEEVEQIDYLVLFTNLVNQKEWVSIDSKKYYSINLLCNLIQDYLSFIKIQPEELTFPRDRLINYYLKINEITFKITYYKTFTYTSQKYLDSYFISLTNDEVGVDINTLIEFAHNYSDSKDQKLLLKSINS